MPEESFQEKTEQATPKKREEARKKGQVAKSKELASIAVLSAGAITLFFTAEHLTSDLGQFILSTFARIPHIGLSVQNLLDFAVQAVETYLWMCLPIMIVLCVVAILANTLQTGLIWSVEPLAPKASKIDPIQGAKRIFSKQSLVEMVKSIAKVVIVGWAAVSTLKNDFSQLIPLIYQEDSQILSFLGRISFKVVVRCCWVIAIMAILDYLYQKWEYEQKLKMSKQEVKDEYKQTEGDPMVKSRIRSIQREMARRRMMEEVPKADVVITNPVHLAIAIRYEPGKMTAPVIVAKGAERIAQRIKALAKENNVPIVEDRPLARNLYKMELGGEIPSQFYQAIAEILAYVYGLKRKTEGMNR
ncbi:MAG: flagellar biosynthesis protein FlhB [Pseudomonadota bacterium]